MAPIAKITVYAYVAAIPHTIGIGQKVYLNGWITPPREYSGAIFKHLDFVITRPDGKTDTKTVNAESSATASFMYLCDKLGTWSVKIKFPGDYLHPACESPTTTWIVQQEPTAVYEGQPLPTGSWTYPISAEYWEWYQIAGSWPQPWYDAAGTNFNPNSKAPNTPHVLWRTQLGLSGIIGETGWSGESGTVGYKGIGSRRQTNVVAAMGRLFYVYPEYFAGDSINSTCHPVLVCIDQYTGKEIYRKTLPCDPRYPWTLDTTTGSGGGIALEILPEAKVDPKTGVTKPSAMSVWLSGNGIWEVDAMTGACLYYLPGSFDARFFNFAGIQLYDGSLYLTNYPKSGNLTRFDTRTKTVVWTKQISDPGAIADDMLLTLGSIPKSWNATTGESIMNGTALDMYSPQRVTTAAYGLTVIGTIDMTFRGVSLTTGEQVWKSEPREAPWGVFTSYTSSAAYGNYYQGSFDGYIYCLNMMTGKLQWRTFLGNSTETATGMLNPQSNIIIADGKCYVAAGERSPPYPLPRGTKLFCLDAFTGDILWYYDGIYASITGGGVSSGSLFFGNMYDGCLYNFGKGETATAVSAPTTVIPLGTGVLIQGTVTDQSPGAPDTPAISDANMREWMQYLYNNRPMPTNATGVSVLLQAMLSNGTVIDITHVTSDIMGHYEYTWTPPTQDTYKILATFEGSQSYYSSSEECGLSVGPATASVNVPSASDVASQVVSQLPTSQPSQISTPVPTVNVDELAQKFANQLPSTTDTINVVIAAVVVAIVIGVVNLALLLKRKKS